MYAILFIAISSIFILLQARYYFLEELDWINSKPKKVDMQEYTESEIIKFRSVQDRNWETLRANWQAMDADAKKLVASCLESGDILGLVHIMGVEQMSLLLIVFFEEIIIRDHECEILRKELE